MKISPFSTYGYNFSVLLFQLILCCIFDALFANSLQSPKFLSGNASSLTTALSGSISFYRKFN